MKKHFFTLFIGVFTLCTGLNAQNPNAANDFNTPLHLMKPAYKIPYGVSKPEEVKAVTDRILNFVNAATPTRLIDQGSGKAITDFTKIDKNTVLEKGTFRLASYEWGVTYAGMITAATCFGDTAYSNYVGKRFTFLANIAPAFEKLRKEGMVEPQIRQVIHPEALDDAGAMCAAMTRTAQLGNVKNLRPLIDNYMNYIMHKEYRLSDGTLARNRPQKNTVWLDDMYMAIPAIARMGNLTGDTTYYKEAVKQVKLFAEKLFVREKNLFRHGWVESMPEHPSFHWARANGWGLLTLTEVLDALPKNYKGRDLVYGLYKSQITGLVALQSGEGFWHQLLDKNDSYLETSATAIYTYCIAHGINEGWLNATVYGPTVQLAWQAVASKVNAAGEVEGTCVGTGMGFDPAYYCYRPVHKYAAHGYGPVILAGAEMYRLLKNQHPKMNDSAVQFYQEEQKTDKPIFSAQ